MNLFVFQTRDVRNSTFEHDVHLAEQFFNIDDPFGQDRIVEKLFAAVS